MIVQHDFTMQPYEAAVLGTLAPGSFATVSKYVAMQGSAVQLELQASMYKSRDQVPRYLFLWSGDGWHHSSLPL